MKKKPNAPPLRQIRHGHTRYVLYGLIVFLAWIGLVFLIGDA